MKTAVLTVIVMIAFAANSVLNRMGLLDAGETGPAAFAAVRLAAGALTLALLASLSGRGIRMGHAEIWGAGTLSLYVLGFSFAYVTLDAGLGALILFGGVQITMFAGSVLAGDTPPRARWVGSAIALFGLGYLLWPGGSGAPTGIGAALMALAALGWGLYSLAGRRVTDPLCTTASAFVIATPVGLLIWTLFPDALGLKGGLLAIISGAITSGLGYALWYSVLPRLQTSTAALAQLTVPLIAVAGGVLFLGEEASVRVLVAALIVLGGVAFGILAPQRTAGSNGS